MTLFAILICGMMGEEVDIEECLDYKSNLGNDTSKAREKDGDLEIILSVKQGKGYGGRRHFDLE